MAGESSYIGLGTSLHGKAPTFEGAYYRRQAAEAAKSKGAKAEKPDEITPADFNIKSDNLLPLYAKLAKDKLAEYANLYKTMVTEKGDDRRAFNNFKLEMMRRRTEMDEIYQNNSNAIDLIEKSKQGSYLFPSAAKLQAAVNNPNTTGEEFAALNNPLWGISATNGYGLTGNLNARESLDPIIDHLSQKEYQEPVGQPTAKVYGDKKMISLKLQPTEDNLRKGAYSIIGNKNRWLTFVDDYLHNGGVYNPKWDSNDYSERTVNQVEDITSYLKDRVRGAVWDITDEPHYPTEAEYNRTHKTKGAVITNYPISTVPDNLRKVSDEEVAAAADLKPAQRLALYGTDDPITNEMYVEYPSGKISTNKIVKQMKFYSDALNKSMIPVTLNTEVWSTDLGRKLRGKEAIVSQARIQGSGIGDLDGKGMRRWVQVSGVIDDPVENIMTGNVKNVKKTGEYWIPLGIIQQDFVKAGNDVTWMDEYAGQNKGSEPSKSPAPKTEPKVPVKSKKQKDSLGIL